MSKDWNQQKLEPFGVAITVDPGLHEAMDDTDRNMLRQLLIDEGVLVIRGMKLSMPEQREFCRVFGPIPDTFCEDFYVSNRRQDGFLGTKELQWHNDVPYLPSPYLVGALHAVEVEPGATSTRFASGWDAYDRLPASLREKVDSLNALQVRQRFSERANRLEDLQPGDLCTVHAVVGVQKETGRRYLFVNENMTACIIGMPREDSDALLAELFSYLYEESRVYEHVWHPGDLVIWDNLAVQHARGQVAESARTLQRVTCTRFTAPEQNPTDMAVAADLYNANLAAGMATA